MTTTRVAQQGHKADCDSTQEKRFDLCRIKAISEFCCECAAQSGSWELREIVAGIFSAGTNRVAIACRDGKHGPAHYNAWLCEKHYWERIRKQAARVHAGLSLTRPCP